ncbi:MAG: histidine phosphatase family protein [Porphyromonas sp.]|nr:histidine phosphatase family protein [Porphyromonas sp.]
MLYIDWIRHTSLQVTGDICYGHSDMPVSDSFEEEAQVVKERLADRKYDAVYVSPLSRARLLCEYCGYQDAIVDPRVMERDFGEWEMRRWEDIFALVETSEGRQYVGQNGELLPPNGESEFQLLCRVRDFIEDLRTSRYQRVAVFCHGGVINSARFFHNDVELTNLFALVPLYGSITTLGYGKLEERGVLPRGYCRQI